MPPAGGWSTASTARSRSPSWHAPGFPGPSPRGILPVPAPESTTVDSLTVDHRALEAAVARLFERVGVEPSQAAGIAEILVLSDLRGLDSHGVRFAARYLRGLHPALLNPRPPLQP